MECKRVNVTLNDEEMNFVKNFAKKKKISKAAVIRKVLEIWIEDYQEKILLQKAIEAEKNWIKNGRKTISHEEMWNIEDGE